MKSVIFFIYLFIIIVLNCSTLNVYAQQVGLISTAEKFNERGYEKSASSYLDGNEIIGEYDGNLSLIYSTHYDLGTDLSYDLTLTYNANVEHRVFDLQRNRHDGYPVNKPVWILGIKGFAVQTTNFEVNYFMENGSSPSIPLTGERAAYLIPGYHYTNKNVPSNVHEGYNLRDYIQILKADGSVLTLYNHEFVSQTGNYFESDYDSYGYAYVQYIAGSNNTLRSMSYKPGDGLTYYFEEDTVKYSDYNFAISPIYPKIMYLKNISSMTGDTIKVSYAGWNEDNLGAYNSGGYGRKLFRSIWSNKRFKTSRPDDNNYLLTYLNYNFTEAYGTRLYSIKFDHSYLSSFTTVILPINQGSPIFDIYRSGSESHSKTKMINNIIDEAGRVNTILYEPNYRNYQLADAFIFHFQSPAYLPYRIDYFNGKQTRFTFKEPVVTIYDYVYTSTSANLSNLVSLNSTHRDDFASFMLTKRELLELGQINLVENFEYIWNNGNNTYTANVPIVENIKTIISRQGTTGSGSIPGNLIITKNFSKYKILAKPYMDESSDYGSSLIRLASETIEDDQNRKLITENKYFTGSLVGVGIHQGYNGLFWIREVTEKTTVNGLTSSRTTSYDYDTIRTQVTNKLLKTKTFMEDSEYLVKEVSVNNFIPSNYSDATAYFRIGLPQYEKVYKGSSIKSYDTYTYYSSGEKTGKLHTVTKNAHSYPRVTTITNDYFTIGYPDYDSLYFGFPKSQVTNNGITTKFYYPKFSKYYLGGYLKYYEIKDTAYGYFLTNDNQKTYKPFEVRSYQTKPFKTEIIYNDGSDTLSKWTNYNSRGDLLFEIDANGLYSEYNYDAVGRITRAKFPGSFYSQSQTQPDTNYILQTYNLLAARQFNINSNNSIGSLNFTRYKCSGGMVPDSSEPPVVDEDAEYDGVYEPDGPIGGGTPSQPNYDFFIFFQDSVSLQNVQSINYANLIIKTKNHFLFPTQSATFLIYGVTQSWQNGRTVYETTGQKTVTFQDYYLMSIDVSGILQSCINADKDLYGFQISAAINSIDSVHRDFFFSSDTIPQLNTSITIHKIDTSNARSSVLFSYDDINNKMEMIKRFNHDPQNNNTIHSLLEYDSFGQLRKTFVKNNSGAFELKKESNFNYLGLKADEKDAENRSVYYSYDYFSRPDTVFFTERNSSAPKQIIQYTPINDGGLFETKTVRDENNKETKIYYRKNGLVDKEEKFNGSTPFITQYVYDNIQRLIEVIPPKGEPYKTTYQYDDHNNIKRKISPDEGDKNYRYDKYGNLRFENHEANPQLVIFNKYDQFNRLILSGQRTIEDAFINLDPDVDYSEDYQYFQHFENYNLDTANFVVVNMYDKYISTGVFSNINTPVSIGGINNKNIKGRLVATAYRDKPGDPWNYKIYLYDELGRVQYFYVFARIESNVWIKVENIYDNTGNVVKQSINNGGFHWWYDYDMQGRLSKVWSNIHNAKTTAKLDALYTYDNSDRILTAEFGSKVKPKMNYTYDSRGRLTGLDGQATDMFNTQFKHTLTYFDNSNIQSMLLQNTGNGNWSNLSFNFTYDGLNRLTNSTCNNSQYSELFTYDSNGNILTKNRSGKNMTYNYHNNTNKINYVSINSLNKSYTHDYRGNIISDGNKGITNINYDRRNLILNFVKNGNTNYYQYDDNGNRIHKNIYNQPGEYYLRDHTGKELAVYEKIGTGRLKMINLYGNGLIGRVDVNYDSTWVEDDE